MEQNGELRISSKIQSKIKSGVESAKPLWAGISSQFALHFHSDARKVSRVSVALNRVTVLPAGANFCKACSLNAASRNPFPELTRICPSLSGAPKLRGVRADFSVDFKPGLINLGAEVHEKSAVKLRDF